MKTRKCKMRYCNNLTKPIVETITVSHWLSKLLGRKKELKIIGQEDYCDKHKDWLCGGLE